MTTATMNRVDWSRKHRRARRRLKQQLPFLSPARVARMVALDRVRRLTLRMGDANFYEGSAWAILDCNAPEPHARTARRHRLKRIIDIYLDPNYGPLAV